MRRRLHLPLALFLAFAVVALAVIHPVLLLLWFFGGVVFGVSIVWLVLQGPKRAAAVIAGAALVVVAAVAVVFFTTTGGHFAMYQRAIGFSYQAPAQLTVVATYRDDALALHETLLIQTADLATAASEFPAAEFVSPAYLQEAVVDALADDGWEVHAGSRQVEAIRDDTAAIDVPGPLPTSRDNTLPVALPAIPLVSSIDFELTMAEGSTLTMITPDGMIRGTDPASEREQGPTGATERVTLALPRIAETVHYEARAWAFRHEPFASFADGPLTWVFRALLLLIGGALGAFGHDWIKQQLSRMRRRPKPAEAKA